MSVQAANYALRACNLKDDVARHVLTALAWRSKTQTPHLVFMKNEDIREDTGLTSINGVKNAINRLVAAGELRVIDVGGRLKKQGALACDFELVGVRQWIEAGEPERREWHGPSAEEAEVSRGDDGLSRHDSKVSRGDGMVSRGDSKLSWRDTHRQDSGINSAVDGGKIATDADSLLRFANKEGKEQLRSQPINGERSKQGSEDTGAGAESGIALTPARRLPTGIAARNATGEVKAALEARYNQLAAMHCDDDDAWFAMLRAEPQFSDISVDAVVKKLISKTGGIVRPQLVKWLFTEDRTRYRKPAQQSRPMTESERKAEEYYAGIERRVGGLNGDIHDAAPKRTFLERSLDETRKTYQQWSPQDWLVLEYLRGRHAAGEITGDRLAAINRKACIPQDFITSPEPPIHLMPDITPEDRQRFESKMQKQEQVAPGRASEPSTETGAGWAVDEPQRVAAGG